MTQQTTCFFSILSGRINHKDVPSCFSHIKHPVHINPCLNPCFSYFFTFFIYVFICAYCLEMLYSLRTRPVAAYNSLPLIFLPLCLHYSSHKFFFQAATATIFSSFLREYLEFFFGLLPFLYIGRCQFSTFLSHGRALLWLPNLFQLTKWFTQHHSIKCLFSFLQRRRALVLHSLFLEFVQPCKRLPSNAFLYFN